MPASGWGASARRRGRGDRGVGRSHAGTAGVSGGAPRRGAPRHRGRRVVAGQRPGSARQQPLVTDQPAARPRSAAAAEQSRPGRPRSIGRPGWIGSVRSCWSKAIATASTPRTSPSTTGAFLADATPPLPPWPRRRARRLAAVTGCPRSVAARAQPLPRPAGRGHRPRLDSVVREATRRTFLAVTARLVRRHVDHRPEQGVGDSGNRPQSRTDQPEPSTATLWRSSFGWATMTPRPRRCACWKTSSPTSTSPSRTPPWHSCRHARLEQEDDSGLAAGSATSHAATCSPSPVGRGRSMQSRRRHSFPRPPWPGRSLSTGRSTGGATAGSTGRAARPRRCYSDVCTARHVFRLAGVVPADSVRSPPPVVSGWSRCAADISASPDVTRAATFSFLRSLYCRILGLSPGIERCWCEWAESRCARRCGARRCLGLLADFVEESCVQSCFVVGAELFLWCRSELRKPRRRHSHRQGIRG